MRFRKLRIAWSVVWGVAAVLSITLWVRSYRHPGFDHHVSGGSWTDSSFRDGAYLSETYTITGGSHLKLSRSRFSINFWQPTTLAAAFATTPWIRQLRFRFTLRSLLIATTLVAMVLGLIVWGIN
jgi:hypothetical protein